jgi:hypothetical protein
MEDGDGQQLKGAFNTMSFSCTSRAPISAADLDVWIIVAQRAAVE